MQCNDAVVKPHPLSLQRHGAQHWLENQQQLFKLEVQFILAYLNCSTHEIGPLTAHLDPTHPRLLDCPIMLVCTVV
jgi:hypothetical protein